jgi:phosphopantetheinyl transferase (holo-ACP synthase)
MEGFVVPGIGVDVVDVERMRFALDRTPRIRQRLFTEAEIAYCENSDSPTATSPGAGPPRRRSRRLSGAA